MANDMLRLAVYGAAVGDALGVPYEFGERDTFTCCGMDSGGFHCQPAGTFSDDTSMMLATCDSIRKAGGAIDVADMRMRFCNWLRQGAYTPDGVAFSVGNTVMRALDGGCGCAGERDNGNGSLMRIIPLAATDATDEQVRAVSAITHAHAVSTEACVAYVHLARELAGGAEVREAVRGCIPDSAQLAGVLDAAQGPRDAVRSGGYVIDTLAAALWCLLHTASYRECVLAAVNLGHDTDTTACVAGGLAALAYGWDSIPQEWLDALRAKDVIESCLF